MRSTVVRRLLPAFLGLILAGCYTYRPTSTTPSPGAQVRVGLEDERGLAGVRAEAEIEGTLTGVDDEALVLLLPRTGVPRRYRRGAPGADTIRLARRQVARVEERRFSTLRTALLAGGVAAAAVLVVDLRGKGEGSSDFPVEGQDPIKSVLARILPSRPR